mmetsp:Transcript_14838/g.27448  ORF Transcript_14838/g.27448 Transcript_14838/m.27448 type:complete len:248 (+) Transcript_14838:146-889(+)
MEQHGATRRQTNGVAVDLGTGSGQVAVPLACSGRFAKVIGIDQSSAQLEHVKDHRDIPSGTSLAFSQGNALDLAPVFPSNHEVSLVTGAQMMHWITRDASQWEAFKMEMQRILLKEGKGTLACIGYRICRVEDPVLQQIFEAMYAETTDLWDPKCDRKLLDTGFQGVDWSPFQDVRRFNLDTTFSMPVAQFVNYLGTWSVFATEDARNLAIFDKFKEAIKLEGFKPDQQIQLIYPFFAIVSKSPGPA